MQNFIPPLLEAVLNDYNASIPAARDHEVLSCMATIVNRLRDNMAPFTIQIFAATFESTLDMITQVRAEMEEMEQEEDGDKEKRRRRSRRRKRRKR